MRRGLTGHPKNRQSGRKFLWQPFILFLLAVPLSGCLDNTEKATVAESIGAYGGRVPPGMASLAVNADGTWEYNIEDKEGQIRFHRGGKWKHNPSEGFGDLTFYDFEFGFPKGGSEPYPPTPYIWTPLITKNGNVIRICFFPTELDCLYKLEGARPDKR
jgi:hypothetical protein